MNGAKKPTVLVVDDAPVNIELIQRLLHEKYVLRAAISGEIALRLVLIDPMPDLILLDVMMSGMDGYEVCRRLKADPHTCDIPVIFVTAMTQTEDEVHGFSLGAVDYLSKPVVPAILRARVNTQIALRQARRELQQKNEQLGEEKELLEDIVMRMNSFSPFDSRAVRHVQRPLEKTAGDIVLSAYRPDGTQHVLVGDFSGHGLSAAFSGPLVSWMFYHLSAEGRDLRYILAELNRTLCRQLPTRLYMAASALSLSPERNKIQMWNYGMPPVLCLTDESCMVRLNSTGLPLGISESMSEFEPHAQFDALPVMRIYQYSDGLTEADSPEQGMFGQARVEALVMRIYREQLPLSELWTALDAHCAGQGLSDDALMVETSVEQASG
jgi:CheY-like chemotaxis protein